MSFLINNRDPVYLQVVRYFKERIATGELAGGQEIPSRRELAGLLKINPNTVQKAFRLMEDEGIVVTPPNAVSAIHWDDDIYLKIQRELTAGLVSEFISHAKANGLSLEMVTDLLQKEWGKGEEK